MTSCKLRGWERETLILLRETDEREGVAEAKYQELTEVNISELAEMVWAALWGLGTVDRDFAIQQCANKLYTDGVINTKQLIRGKTLKQLLNDGIDEAIEFDFLDSPKEGSVRAIIRAADFYEPEDWEMCVKRSLFGKTLKRSDAIMTASQWARDNLGLEFVDVQIGSLIWEELDTAIGRLLERSELELQRGGMIKTAAPKAQTTPVAPTVDEPGEETREPKTKVKRRVVTLVVDEPDDPVAPTPPRRQTARASQRHMPASVDRWNDGYRRLEKYVAREGTARVSKRYREDDGYPLGQWVCEQRKVRHRISTDRKAALERLPGWMWYVKIKNEWEESFSYLLHFVEREGHAKVPYGHIEDDYGLGRWVAYQRRRRDEMSAEQRAAFEGLPGWEWTQPRPQRTWEDNYGILLRYVELEGHARVPTTHVEDGYKLGRWVATQRSRRDALSAEKKAALERLPGWAWRIH